MNDSMPTDKPLIVSLFDYSGNWPYYFKAYGFDVIQVDLKHGVDVLTWTPPDREVFGLLAAPPCTDFSASGAQYWKAKDADGRTEHSVRLVEKTLRLVDELKPTFWILENPVGRLYRWLGKPKEYFHPYEWARYAPNPETDRYTKRTCLWGEFRLPRRLPMPPVATCPQGSWIQKLGGSSEQTKERRSTTPMGFAFATWLANHSTNYLP